MGQAAGCASPVRGEIFVVKNPHELFSSVRSGIMFVHQEYAAPDGAFSFRDYGSTNMSRRRQFFAVWEMVAVPAYQGNVVGVFKQRLQRWRFDMSAGKSLSVTLILFCCFCDLHLGGIQ
jgi:hypothetical protein